MSSIYSSVVLLSEGWGMIHLVQQQQAVVTEWIIRGLIADDVSVSHIYTYITSHTTHTYIRPPIHRWSHPVTGERHHIFHEYFLTWMLSFWLVKKLSRQITCAATPRTTTTAKNSKTKKRQETNDKQTDGQREGTGLDHRNHTDKACGYSSIILLYIWYTYVCM